MDVYGIYFNSKPPNGLLMNMYSHVHTKGSSLYESLYVSVTKYLSYMGYK